MAKKPDRTPSSPAPRTPVYRLPGTSGEVSMDALGDEIRARAARMVCRLARDEEERTSLLAMLGLEEVERTTVSERLPTVR